MSAVLASSATGGPISALPVAEGSIAAALEPFAAALIVGLWGVLCLLAARVGRIGAVGLARVVPAVGLGLALLAALGGLDKPELVGEVYAGALFGDRMAALLDALLVVAMLAAVLADPRADDGRAAWCRGLLLLAGAGAMLAVHAADWPTMLAGIELASLATGLCLAAGDGPRTDPAMREIAPVTRESGAPAVEAMRESAQGGASDGGSPAAAGEGGASAVEAMRESARATGEGGPPAARGALVDAAIAARGRRAARTWLLGQGLGAAVLWLGVGLVVAATGTIRLDDLGGRVGAVFLRWGANTAQAAVELLQNHANLPAGLLIQARNAAVEGMAPAALFVPGVLLLVAGLLIRAGVFPLLAGRIAAAGRAGTCGWVAAELVVRTAAVGALIRVLVTILNAPRVVFAPYGWGTAAIVVAGIGALVAGLRAARAADLQRLLAWVAATQTGLGLLALAAAANFVAHAGLRGGGLEITDHFAWGQRAAEAAVAAALAGHVVLVLGASGVMAAAAAVTRGRGAIDLAGLGRRHPLVAAALAVCALALAGAPPTAGLPARWWLLVAVLEDTNPLVRASAGAAAIGAALAAWACLRPLLAALAPPGPAAPPAGRARAGGALVAAVLASMLLGAGLYTQVLSDMVERAAAGVGFAPGSAGRREWLGPGR